MVWSATAVPSRSARPSRRGLRRAGWRRRSDRSTPTRASGCGASRTRPACRLEDEAHALFEVAEVRAAVALGRPRGRRVAVDGELGLAFVLGRRSRLGIERSRDNRERPRRPRQGAVAAGLGQQQRDHRRRPRRCQARPPRSATGCAASAAWGYPSTGWVLGSMSASVSASSGIVSSALTIAATDVRRIGTAPTQRHFAQRVRGGWGDRRDQVGHRVEVGLAQHVERPRLAGQTQTAHLDAALRRRPSTNADVSVPWTRLRLCASAIARAIWVA